MEALMPLRMAHADMPEAIQNPLIEQNVIGSRKFLAKIDQLL
jgi:hypothetical protein